MSRGRRRTQGSVVGSQYTFGITSINGSPSALSASGVALARISVDAAVARWREVHRPLLAVGSDTVARHVPRCSEGMQVTAHPFPDPPLAEWFH